MAMSASADSIAVPPLTSPARQNTATVLEFRCLYTPDLRRKQKRWQDGRLKFHTFNKRVMVYADGGNFVGDTHWREDHDFGEGDELELERCGNLVQVSECVGRREQDMTQLLDKRIKEKEGRFLARRTSSSPIRPLGQAIQITTVNVPLVEPSQEASVKRRRLNISLTGKNGYAKALTGATLTLSGALPRSQPLLYDPLWLKMTKLPIKSINLTGPRDAQPMPQKTNMVQSSTQSKPNRNARKPLPPLQNERAHVQNIIEPALVVGEKVREALIRGLSSTRSTKEVNIDTRASAAHILGMQEDDFTDTDVYKSGCSKANQALEPPHGPAFLMKTRKATPLRVPEPAKAFSRAPKETNYEKSLNALRIRPRAKTKLLFTAQSRPHFFPSPVRERGMTVHEDIASSLETDEIDYHKIDKVLTRESSGHNAIARIRENDTRNHESHSGSITESRPDDASICEIQESAGIAQRSAVDKLSQQLISEQEIIQKQVQEQPRFLRGNDSIEKIRHRTNTANNSKTVLPRLVSREGDGLPPHKERNSLKAKREIRQNPKSSDLDEKENQQPSGAAAKVSEEIVCPPKLVVQAKLAHSERGGKDQGAWSREAFDLFDWKPKTTRTVSGGLVVC